MDAPHMMNTAQASVYLGLAHKTLETLRSRGGGPRFVKYGRKAVRYLKRDLDVYIMALTCETTSDFMKEKPRPTKAP